MALTFTGAKGGGRKPDERSFGSGSRGAQTDGAGRGGTPQHGPLERAAQAAFTSFDAGTNDCLAIQTNVVGGTPMSKVAKLY